MIHLYLKWNRLKRATSKKHGVRFELAIDVFRDVFALDLIGDRFDYGEERCIIIGMAQSRLLYVAYTMRGETIRLISARAAEPFEQRSYYDANT